MAYTDGGSMKGSGVDSHEQSMDVECENIDCIFEGTVDAEVDDFGTLRWDCPKCGREHETEDTTSEPDPDYRPGEDV